MPRPPLAHIRQQQAETPAAAASPTSAPPAVAKSPRLSPAQKSMLTAATTGQPFAAASHQERQTMASLLKRGLVDDSGNLTDAGRAATFADV
jgi:hypothetical protein